MVFQPDKHHRQSIRLRHYDYGSSGAYFVTVCSHQKQHLFGHIEHGQMMLNDIGNIVHDEWLQTPILRPNVILDSFVIMPNHVLCLFFIETTKNQRDDESLRRGVLQYAPTVAQNNVDGTLSKFQSPSQTVGAIIRGYKGTTTKRINQHRQTPTLPVWQRNYYERVIRNDDELNAVRTYIENNPSHWLDAEENL